MPSNPYQTPKEHTANASTKRTHWYQSFVSPIAVMAFWTGVPLGVIGSLITFVPIGEAYWFGFVSLFFAAGLFADNAQYKIAALVLLVLCLSATYNGLYSGITPQKSFSILPH